MWQHCILWRIQQFEVCIIYKPGPYLYIANWVSQQYHAGNKEQEIKCIELNIDVLRTSSDKPTLIVICGIQDALKRNDHLQKLKKYIIEEGYSQERR